MGFKDSNNNGRVAEEMYKKFLIKSGKIEGKDFIDVRDSDELCQWLDIDFIILHNGHNRDDVLNEIRNGNPEKRKQRIKEIGYAVEVKLDTVTHCRHPRKDGTISNGTGNLVYEIISHNMPGCMARSYADFILYVCVDIYDYIAQLKEVYMINLYNWRNTMTKFTSIQNQGINLKPLESVSEYNQGKQQVEIVTENILNILHPVRNLLDTAKTKIGTITKWTDKLVEFFPNNLHITK